MFWGTTPMTTDTAPGPPHPKDFPQFGGPIFFPFFTLNAVILNYNLDDSSCVFGILHCDVYDK